MPTLAREVEETNELAFGVKRGDYGCLDWSADERVELSGREVQDRHRTVRLDRALGVTTADAHRRARQLIEPDRGAHGEAASAMSRNERERSARLEHGHDAPQHLWQLIVQGAARERGVGDA